MKRAMKILLHSFAQNADFLALILVLQFWPFLTNTPLNLSTALALAGLCIVYRLAAIGREIRTQGSAVPAVEAKREFVENPGAVLELAKLTGHDAIRRLTPYLGKWITLSGRFEGIAESLQKDAVHLSLLLDDGRRMNLRFSTDYLDQLQTLREGQRLSAVGRIPSEGLVFSPENCELVRVEPVRLAYAS
jgi:hypothetical protein